MGNKGRRSHNFKVLAPVRITPDMRETLETIAEHSGCSMSDVIRTCLEVGLTQNPTASLALKQLQRGLEDRRLP